MSNSQAVTMVGNSLVRNKEANHASLSARHCWLYNAEFEILHSGGLNHLVDSIFRYNLHARALIRQLGKSP